MSEQRRSVPGCTDPERGSALEGYLERRLDPDEEEAFEAHFYDCAACLEELRLRQALPAALQEVRSGQQGVPRWIAPVGAVAAALIVYTSYLGFVELPSAKGKIGSLTNELTGLKSSVQELNAFRDASRWTGQVSMAILKGVKRGGTIKPEIVRVIPGQPFVPLGAMAPVPDTAKPDDRYALQIRGAEDVSIWEMEMKASQIKQAVDADGVVSFLIPSDKLVAGDYHLVVVAAGGDPGKPLWQAFFTVNPVD